jgi:hypothetical protein
MDFKSCLNIPLKNPTVTKTGYRILSGFAYSDIEFQAKNRGFEACFEATLII